MHMEHSSVNKMYDYNKTPKGWICQNAQFMKTQNTITVIMIEGKDPPPFGQITHDALSPCLFTLLQQLGHEGVNKASSPSTASIRTSARNICSLPGPCLCTTMLQRTGEPVGHEEAQKALL